MEPSRFDALTRSLVAPKTRRGILGALAAIGAGIAARGTANARAQCANFSCKNNPGKCGAGCVCCVFGNGNTRCLAPGSCSGTPTCPPGQVAGPSGCGAPTTTTTTTTEAPSVCATDSCVSGDTGCGPNGQCRCYASAESGQPVCINHLAPALFQCALDADCDGVTGPGSACINFVGPHCGGAPRFCAPRC